MQSIEAIIQRQQRTPECDDHCLLGFGENSRTRLLWPTLGVFDCLSLATLRDRLGVNARFSAKLRERSLQSLYRSSDGVRSRGAAVTNFSHNASFDSYERIAPSNRGIKHTTICAFFGQYYGYEFRI